MNSRLASNRLIVVSCFALALFGICTARTEARPKYKSVFEATYPEVAKKIKKVNCNLCHFGDDKKKRNHYGEALAKELKKPNVMDEKTVKEALKAIESGDCKSGKWKERLENGEAPCVCGNRDHNPNSYIARQLDRSGN